MVVWLNGRFVPASRARVSALDRGLLHGDGVYDTWRTYDGEPFAVPAHHRRLRAAARLLGLPRLEPAARWVERSRQLIARNGLPDATLRLTVTRGVAGEGVLPTASVAPTLLLSLRPLPPDLARQQAEGIAVVTLPFPRDNAPWWGGVKLLGHASAVAGKLYAARAGAVEGLYVTPEGQVTEGTTSNLVLVEGRRLVTAPLASGVLGGVTRDLVLRLARRDGLVVREEPIAVRRLRRADEILITASTIEVVPVVRLDGHPVGSATPGPMTRRLQQLYREAVTRTVSRSAIRVRRRRRR